MRRLLALVFTVMLWLGFTANPAHALYDNLKPCKDVSAFMDRASTSQGGDVANRIDFYANKANLLCGEDGLPHLIIDNPAHAGEFIIPGVMFLYIAGWIGWVGRAYLQKIQKGKNPEEQEIIINVPLAISCMLSGFAWPLAAFGEFSSGKLLAKDEEVTVSPR